MTRINWFPIPTFSNHHKFICNTKLNGEKSIRDVKDEKSIFTFIETSTNKSIKCVVDCVAKINGIEHTVGIPIDNPIDVCIRNDEKGYLKVVELDNPLMGQCKPIIANKIKESFVLFGTFAGHWGYLDVQALKFHEEGDDSVKTAISLTKTRFLS